MQVVFLSKKRNQRFIDLFAGIGGFHLGMEAAGGECVFVSEWDKFARQTYAHNFSKTSPGLFNLDDLAAETPTFVGDITKIADQLKNGNDVIPDFEVLTGGFPCQPFSHAGLRKGMDEARGTLFFDILQILKTKIKSGKPVQAFFLENVRGLLNHQSGDEKTIEIIERNLRKLGYTFGCHLVWASDFGVPQHRPRVFLIGFYDPKKAELFTAPQKQELTLTMSDIMGGEVPQKVGRTLRVGGRGSGVHDRRNWDSYLVNGIERRLGPSEGLRMQGFPDGYEFPSSVSEAQAMKQLGNSVAVPAIAAYAKAIGTALGWEND
jgi:DNA (cytosine-5)-methyltransferase 1